MKFSIVSLAALLLLPIGTAALSDSTLTGNGADAVSVKNNHAGRVLKGKKGKGSNGKGGKGKGKGGKGKGTKEEEEGKGGKGKGKKEEKESKGGKGKEKDSKGGKGKEKDSKGGKGKEKDSKGGKSGKSGKGKYFNRIATFPICQQLDPTCDTDAETAAEIVAVTEDENTVLYTNSPQEAIGFVDITYPSEPVGKGYVLLGAEPTSVAVAGGYALAAVNTSPDFVNPSGHLAVIDIEAMEIVREIDLGGQPDSVAVSPDGKYAGVVIENERDEDLGDGVIPQEPPGYFVIVDISSPDPQEWYTTIVDLTGLDGVGVPEDPEPEYVTINSHNIAAITLQENNAIVLVDMETASVTHSFNAGLVDLEQIDTIEEGALILQDSSLDAVPREPDGIVWITDKMYATADEGDMDGGSRGFTIYDIYGNIVYTSGNTVEHLVASIGHYPDERSENKGSEPENVFFGKFGKDHLLFLIVERSSVVVVYDVKDPKHPEFVQVLPSAGPEPEGGVAIPGRNLIVVATEEDDRGGGFRGVLNIYSRGYSENQYPTIQSMYRDDGTPIPYGALSGLAPDPKNDCIIYSVEDNFYIKSRIFHIDVCSHPAALYSELRIVDTNDVFKEVGDVGMINDDKTVNIDPEGIAAKYDQYGHLHYFVASEGSGAFGDDDTILNMIFQIDSMGVIEDVIFLPDEVNELQIRFGFEGVAEYDGRLYVAFQRAWTGEEDPRIGIYDLEDDSWSFVFYELDEPESQNGGWVGLSDITPIGDDQFLVLERDNQAGLDAAIKRIYKIDLSDYGEYEVVDKEFFHDILPDNLEKGGLALEKWEGLAYNHYGVWAVNDNDGVDDNAGEIQLLHIEKW